MVTDESHRFIKKNLRAALTSANFYKVSETESHILFVQTLLSLCNRKQPTHLICLLGKTQHFLQIIQAVSDGLLSAVHLVWVSFRKIIICT